MSVYDQIDWNLMFKPPFSEVLGVVAYRMILGYEKLLIFYIVNEFNDAEITKAFPHVILH